jgi:hypothetical protein
VLTTDEAEQIAMALQRNAGSNVHAANKAAFYLRQIADKPNPRFSNCQASEFVSACRNAAYTSDWKHLKNLMAGWW